MSDKEQSKLPHAVLRDFVRWLKSEGVAGIIIGGIAASILGRPRVTRDVDGVVIIDQASINEFIESGKRHGFIPRIKDVLGFAKKTRVLLMKHGPTNVDVDISLGVLPFEHEIIARAVWVDVGNFSLPIPTSEDLIIMKAVAHRQRDIADIESILDANPNLDFKRIRKWVREFSNVLEMPEILGSLEKIFEHRKRKRKKR
jgi:predicted nucleotidyltransferase